MNNKLISVLAGVAAVLVLIVIGEWWYAQQVKASLLNAVVTPQKHTVEDAMPSIDLTGQREEDYVDLVDRPLFIKGRKPVDEPDPKQTQASAVAVKFDWALNGVYTTKKGLSALFSRATMKVPKDNFRKLSEGGDLDGWKLTEIHYDHVVLTQDSTEKELLLRKPKLKQLPTTKANNAPQPPGQGKDIPQPQPEPEPEVEPEAEPEPTDESIENLENDE
ncbi:MAG: hypothetical protein PHR16_00575 [Methylovulum sp.]|nr:hypothetical protein [Methylovulum sp.]